MAEWWSVVALFWLLYLADGVFGGRREKLFLSGWRRGRRASLAQARWHAEPPVPWAWTLPLEDAPFSLSSQGVVNWPSVSTGRPPPLPESLVGARWEEFEPRDVRRDGGWILLKGRRLAPESAMLDAAGLRGLAQRLRPLDTEQRRRVIAAWWSGRLSATRARRRVQAALGRSRGLAFRNTLQVAGWAALSAALLTERFVPAWNPGVIHDWRSWHSPQAPWWMLIVWLAIAHGLSVWEAWRLHGRLHPARREERANLLFSATLLPAQALRFRSVLLRPLAREGAPVVFAIAAASPRAAREAAESTWRDLCHPFRPESLPAEVAAWADEAAKLARPALEKLLAEAGWSGAELAAAPARFSESGACAYCPRCGSGFTSASGVCPRGVRLVAIGGAGGEAEVGSGARRA